LTIYFLIHFSTLSIAGYTIVCGRLVKVRLINRTIHPMFLISLIRFLNILCSVFKDGHFFIRVNVYFFLTLFALSCWTCSGLSTDQFRFAIYIYIYMVKRTIGQRTICQAGHLSRVIKGSFAKKTVDQKSSTCKISIYNINFY